MTDDHLPILDEQRLSLTELARLQNKSMPTVWRWCTRGVKGVLLSSYSVGGRRYTSLESFQRWVASLTAVQHGGANAPPPRTSRQRDAAATRAEARCKRHGV